MSGFSQPERRGLERMQVTKPEAHPDADLLTAFTEHSLTPREREQVLAHLASCADCREVVAVAGSPLVEPVPEPVRKRAFWEIPVFRWGAVAATTVVVVAAVSLGVHERSESPMQKMISETPPTMQSAENKVVAEPSAANEKSSVAGVLEKPEFPKKEVAAKTEANAAPVQRRAPHLQEQVRYEAPHANQDKDERAAGGELAQNAVPAPAAPKVAAAAPTSRDAMVGSTANGGLAKGENAPMMAARNVQDLKQVPPPAAGAAAGAPSREAANYARVQAPPQANQTVAVTSENVMVQTAPPPPPPVPSEVKNSLAPAAQTAEITASKTKRLKAFAFETGPIKSLDTGTTWQITRDGILQRSSNGTNWESMLSDHTFRTLTVFSNHVWAGGDHGLLYSSADNGSTWNSQFVHSGDTSVTGTIVRLHFTDTQTGSLQTSTGETWNTGDGGQTWSKQ